MAGDSSAITSNIPEFRLADAIMLVRIVGGKTRKQLQLNAVGIVSRSVVVNQRQQLFNSCHRPLVLFYGFNLCDSRILKIKSFQNAPRRAQAAGRV